MTTTIHEFLFGGLSMKAVGLGLGALLVLSHLFGLLRAAPVQEFLKKFPRNHPIGVFLLIIAALWAWILMNEIHMGEFYTIRPKILIGIPIAAVLVSMFVDEFLSVRALGALMLLAAAPVLNAAFLQPQWTRLLLPLLAYGWIFAGLFFVGMPYLARDFINWFTAKTSRWRAACIAGILYGALLFLTAFLTY